MPDHQVHEEQEAAPFLPLETSHDLPAFPLEALPREIADFARQLADNLETPVCLPACLALGALSSVCMRRYVVSPRVDWHEPLNLYLAVALEPGESKSPVFRQVFAPLRLLEKEAVQVWEKDVQNILANNKNLAKGEEPEPLPPRPRLLLSGDSTAEKLAVLMAEQGERIAIASAEGSLFDHLSGLYSKNGVNNLDLYMQGYDSEHFGSDRIARDSVIMERPSLAMTLAVQPSVIRDLSKQPRLRGRGLLARFCYAFPASKIGSQTFEAPPVDPMVRDAWRDLVLRLGRATTPKEPEELRFSPEAWERLRLVAAQISMAMAPGSSLFGVRDWASKLRGLLSRFAGLLHVAEEATPGRTPVSLATLERALQIGRYFVAHTRYALETEMTLDPVEQAARQAWEVIQRRGLERVTPGRLAGWIKALRKTADATAALEHLCERGYLRRDPEHRGQGKVYLIRSRGGRLPPSDPVCPPSDQRREVENKDKPPPLTLSSDQQPSSERGGGNWSNGSDGSDGSDGPTNPQNTAPHRSDGRSEGRSDGEPTTTPPPVSGVTAPPGTPANDLPAVDLAAGDDEGWEPLE